LLSRHPAVHRYLRLKIRIFTQIDFFLEYVVELDQTHTWIRWFRRMDNLGPRKAAKRVRAAATSTPPTPKNILFSRRGGVIAPKPKKLYWEGWGEPEPKFQRGVLCYVHNVGVSERRYHRYAPKTNCKHLGSYLCTMGGESRRLYVLRWRVGLARSLYVVSHARACYRSGVHAREHAHAHRDGWIHTPSCSPKVAKEAIWGSCWLQCSGRACCTLVSGRAGESCKKVLKKYSCSGPSAAQVEVPRHQMLRLTSEYLRCVCIDHGHPPNKSGSKVRSRDAVISILYATYH
ncbi:unnamed protein product, partial [Ectocarpus sp. 4 AP-2014]